MSITNINLNLLPPELRPRRVIHWIPIYTLTLIVALVVFVATNSIITLWNLRGVGERIDLHKADITRLTPFVQEYDYLNSVKAALEKRELMFLYVQNGYIDWVAFMRELEGKVPSGVWLTDLSTDKYASAAHAGHINIKGKTSDNLVLSIAQFVENLEESPYFSNVTFIRSSSVVFAGVDVQEFAVSLDFTPPTHQVAAPEGQQAASPAPGVQPKPAPKAVPGGGKT